MTTDRGVAVEALPPARARRDFVVAGVQVAIALSAVGLFGHLRRNDVPVGTTALLAAVAFIVERRRVSLAGRLSASASYLPILLAAVIGGAEAAIIVAATSMLAHFGAPYTRWFVWTCTNVTAGALAGAAAGALVVSGSIGRTVAASGVAGITLVAASLALAGLTIGIRGGPWRHTLVAGIAVTVSAMAVYVPIGAMLAVAYEQLGIWFLVAVFPPVVAAQQLLVLYQQQREATASLARAVDEAEAINVELEAANSALAATNRELEEANLAFVASLVVSLDARDHYTAGHSAAVAVYSRDIARALGLSIGDQQRVYLAGLVHDVGKVGLPSGILEKEAPLSADEETIMHQHVLIGERIVNPVSQLRDLAPAIRNHHERFDGSGYPDGLTGGAIPLVARIVAVADTYNAMTSDRPYRSALAPDIATETLLDVAGTQLDPEMARIFVSILRTEDAAYKVARRAEFVIDFERIGRIVDLDELLTKA
jgi:HD-GYP domain-containing protein (c-di-GMP phosphodiesterase class II)